MSVLERLGSFEGIAGDYYDESAKFRYYPAFLMLYTGGIAALANNNLNTLRAILYEPTTTDFDAVGRLPLIFLANSSTMRDPLAKALKPNTLLTAVVTYHIRDSEDLWRALRKYIHADDRFNDLFLEFEYLFGLVHTDIALQTEGYAWGPRGTLPYSGNGFDAKQLMGRINNQIEQLQSTWPPLIAGMFGGSMERLLLAKKEFDPLAISRSY